MLGNLIGAGASIIGGLLGKSSADKQAENQERFAKNAVQWKVADALKAGVHPLYALGAQTTSYSPVSVGTDLGTGIRDAGQDLSRAVAATSDDATKARGYASAVQELTIQRMGLENQLLSSQIAKITQGGGVPPSPSPGQRFLVDGQAQSGALVETSPMARSASEPGAPHSEPGAIPEVGWTRTATGGWAPVMSNDAKQRLEEDFIGKLGWSMRNRVLPVVDPMPPKAPIAKDHYWYYDPVLQEYRPYKNIYYGRTYSRGGPSYYGR